MGEFVDSALLIRLVGIEPDGHFLIFEDTAGVKLSARY
jgi:hypothetical protein